MIKAIRRWDGKTLLTMSAADYSSHWPEICRLIGKYGGQRIDKSGKVQIIINDDICNKPDVKI